MNSGRRIKQRWFILITVVSLLPALIPSALAEDDEQASWQARTVCTHCSLDKIEEDIDCFVRTMARPQPTKTMEPFLLKQAAAGNWPRAAWYLAELNREGKAGDLEQIGMDQSRPATVRLAAALALHIAGKQMPMAALSQLLSAHLDWPTKHGLICMLGYCKDKAAVNILFELATSPDRGERCAALLALARCQSEKVLPVARGIIEKSSDPMELRAAVRAVASVDSMAAADALVCYFRRAASTNFPCNEAVNAFDCIVGSDWRDRGDREEDLRRKLPRLVQWWDSNRKELTLTSKERMAQYRAEVPEPSLAFWRSSMQSAAMSATMIVQGSRLHRRPPELNASVVELTKLLEDAKRMENPAAIAVSFSNLGNCYFFEHQYEKAGQFYEQAVSALASEHRQQTGCLKGLIIENLINYVRCQNPNPKREDQLMGDLRQAKEEYYHFSKPDILSGVWWIHSDLGGGQLEPLDRETLGAKAPKVKPEDGIALYKAGRYKEAIQAFYDAGIEDSVIGRASEDPNVIYYWALAKHKLGGSWSTTFPPIEMLDELRCWYPSSPVAALALATRNQWLEEQFGAQKAKISLRPYTYVNPTDKPPPGGGVFAVHYVGDEEQTKGLYEVDIKINGKPATALLKPGLSDNYQPGYALYGAPQTFCGKKFLDKLGMPISTKPSEDRQGLIQGPESQKKTRIVDKKWRMFVDIEIGGVMRHHIPLEVIDKVNVVIGCPYLPDKLLLSPDFFTLGYFSIDRKKNELTFTGKLTD